MAQQSADLADNQRSAMEAQLKVAEEKTQTGPAERRSCHNRAKRDGGRIEKGRGKGPSWPSRAQILPQRSVSKMEAQLKKAEEKAQAAQQSADRATTERSAMEAQLKSAEEKAQAALQSADRAATGRSTMEAQLKAAEEKAQAAQQSADRATTERSAMEAS